jgi:PBSX family phage terminase large subunit
MVAVARPAAKRSTVIVDYWPIGGAAQLWKCRDPEVLIEGPAGTGKTVACLQKIHRALGKYAGARALVCRKTQKSLKESALVTYQRRVLHPLDGVSFYGGSGSQPAAFRYPNGSELLVAGLDNPEKVKSSEYDLIYPNEATELTLDDWEMLISRRRNGVMPYQQLMGDANPTYPKHWLNERCNSGATARILSRHEENPRYYDQKRQGWTAEGLQYLATLESLTGIRRVRLLEGKWAVAEGQVLDAFDRAIHVITRDQLDALGFGNPSRHVAGVDWGYTNPGSIEVHAVGADGRLCLVDETYMTRKTQDWWVNQGQRVKTQYGVSLFVCDPAEPAYIKAFNDAGLHAVPAPNAILPGLTAFQERLAVQDDGRPRYYVLADAPSQVDGALVEAHKPTGFLDEVDTYVWGPGGRAGKERPVDDANHAIDPCRYVVLYLDTMPPPAKPAAPIPMAKSPTFGARPT